MRNMVCNVSGIDSDPEARDVFVWCRNRGAGTNLLVAAGRVVGSGGGYVPPGGLKGQYRVTFILPDKYVTDDVQVTADKDGKKILSDVTVATPCLAPAEFQSGVPVTPADLAARADRYSRPGNRGQIIVIRSTELET
jgi:hypothetical protein